MGLETLAERGRWCWGGKGDGGLIIGGKKKRRLN
jgi:hypothetical protein